MPELGLLDPSSVRRIAAELDLRPTKQWGQNFVVDANTVRRIVSLSGVTADDVVLEIGPGLGSLTLGLLETGARVVAVEIEDRLADRLTQTVRERMGEEAAARIDVVAADALQVAELPVPPTALVANLPYNVSVPVLLHLLELFPDWRRGLVMVQLEVADRLVAPPGGKVYGVPSAKTAWYADTARVGTVPPKVFWPVPNVDSGLVRIERREPRQQPRPGNRPSRSSTRPSPSAARCCAPRWPESLARPLPHRKPSRRRGSTRPCAARRSTSARSHGSPSASTTPDGSRGGSAVGSCRDQHGAGEGAREGEPCLAGRCDRPSGFHELGTVFQAVSLGDEIVADQAAPGVFRLAFQGEGAAFLPVDDTNLAMRAAKLLAQSVGRTDVGVSLLVRKRIPVAGGMAGGSADAAGVLVACNALWGLGLSRDDLHPLAAELGSDVPFLLLGGTAIGTGRGST